MENTAWMSRTELLVGKEKLGNLMNSHVLVMGLGGVGSYAAELLCRAGVGELTIVDGDKVEMSNRNRQLPALQSTLGKSKAEVVSARLLDVNPALRLNVINKYIEDKEMENLLETKFDYVVDAIDTLSPKVNLIYQCMKNNIPIVSSMGAGAKFDPSQVRVADVSKSYNCTLARKLRKRLYKLGVYKGFKVVFSSEEIVRESVVLEPQRNKKSTVGTISYMPPIFGCYCASVVLRDLMCLDNKMPGLNSPETAFSEN
ncbi:MAG: tRNA threonylcarbamoyladenosine dehydratase [Ignavibacteria bacterium]|nr:tRNA threonylcarbamoyladenosine dehydratase [Ignavibacteria bacterium]MCU7501947.1 tRNA threonylcarbamoyladenosine dehydratase [Ignavibacteria bacterium]MCU7516915.1 tRNA threonylcarbamoyladenosine dehydratase [Ignavibacteria bacterium]